MAENEHENEQQQPESPERPETTVGREDAANYFSELMGLFKRPDDFFTDTYRGQKLFGLINLVVLVALLAFATFVTRAAIDFDFDDVLYGMKYGLAIAIPLAAVLFVFPWYAKQQGNELSLDFMLEKLGGAVALSAVLVLIAIPLNLLDIDLHSWLRGAAMTLVYIAVFMMSYWYMAPNRLATATVSVIAFYFLYRLIYLIL